MPPKVQHDTELLRSVASGDQAAFGVLFDRWSPKVMKVAVMILSDHDAAEDIVQDVFVKVWTKRAGLADIEDIEGWLFIMTRNFSFNALKKRAYAKGRLESLRDELPAYVETVDDLLVARDYETLILRAMEGLTEQQWNVFELSRKGEMSREEIAAALGLSGNTVKMHLLRARKIVRAYLAARIELPVLVALSVLHNNLF